ncbi:DUF6153 family protein [Microbacterium sp. 4-7]|uniref:DUF6153 family protein n=1 Tax=Microbacterium sp. 4-7 TaxID=1885327 RepID=UPI001650D2DD|nr:DUF6153 family protein [Microbacterium sp. 4-7]
MQLEHRELQVPVCLRAALLWVAGALLIIVGLLGMHTFSADSGGHGAAVPTHFASADDLSDHVAASTVKEHASSCDDACVTGSGGGHSGMTSVCILALLAGLLILLRPLLERRLGRPPQLSVSRLRLDATLTLNHTPSLIFLSISRT